MSALTVAIHEHVATVMLDRPPVNAITTAVMLEMTETFNALGDNREVRAVIFTAAGDRAFMAGVDLDTVGQTLETEHPPPWHTTDPNRANTRHVR